ncbi:MAG: ATP-binding protein [Nanoarchaeota archaeon]|nr:ATP-binding protein [Nanoarchaeota archaeon]
MKELMFEMNPWWEESPKSEGIFREKYLEFFEKNLNNKDIIFITGLRRVGKSTLLKHFIFRLIKEKDINPKRIMYLSLDAYLFKENSIHELVKEFRKIHNIKINEKIYLFLDEVVYKKDFNQELKNLYDSGNIKIYATSSSASLLRDKKAFLTGRTRTLGVDPLDFQEFLLFKNYSAKKSEKYMLEKYFEEYMEYGGMPEYVLTKDPNYITNLVESIIYKDIIALHNLKNSSIIKDLFKLLCERVGKQVSYNKIANVLGIHKDSVKDYINYFVESYLFYLIEKDAKSLNERIKDNKKIYCSDVGIKNVTAGFKDLGAIYENLVFLKIKGKNPRYLKKDGIEIDFKIKDTIIEAKYKRVIDEKQKKLFDSINIKNKIIAQGIDFFEK